MKRNFFPLNIEHAKLPSLEKEGWQPLRLTGWFVLQMIKKPVTFIP